MKIPINYENLIKYIKLPSTNIKYDKTSADGYACLAYAYIYFNIDQTKIIEKIRELNYTLRNVIKIKNINVTRNNTYIYTYWICYDYFRKINDKNTLNHIYDSMKNIGTYNNGLVRYCAEEIYYGVPNTTSAMALVHCYQENYDVANELVGFLRKTQNKNGNWNYYEISPDLQQFKILENREEDSMHLCMMVYHLMKIEKNSNITTKDIYTKSLELLKIMNKDKISPGSIGWGIPYIALVMANYDKQLFEKSFNLLITVSINNTSFRVRAISAWVITKLLEDKIIGPS